MMNSTYTTYMLKIQYTDPIQLRWKQDMFYAYKFQIRHPLAS
jgi:hypothetical protein